MSLRNAINEKCRDCIHDELAPGTWKQQVSLCSVNSCPLYEVRPVSKSPIPERVLSYYGIKMYVFQKVSKNSSTDTKPRSLSSQVAKSGTSQDFRA